MKPMKVQSALSPVCCAVSPLCRATVQGRVTTSLGGVTGVSGAVKVTLVTLCRSMYRV